MIVFDISCVGQGHVFEAWFGSSGDYESQRERGLVTCPICGSGETRKAVMAPRLSSGGGRDLSAASTDAEEAKQMLAAAAAAQKKLLATSEHVGDRFAAEAQAIHLGEGKARSIHGRASREQTHDLLAQGIQLLPLPFPVLEPGQEN